MLTLLLPALVGAILPTLVIVALIWWSDRYEREPWWLLLVTFLWGAAPAILLSVAAELLLEHPLLPYVPGLSSDLLRVGLIAPVVEEIAKGLALFGLYLFFPFEMDDVLDGIVYGALIGAGFGMTENFLYFLNALLQEAPGGIWGLALLRSVIFGANHAYYTAILGAAVAVGVGMGRGRRRWPVVWLGLAGAIGVHALHNVSTTVASTFPPALFLSIVLDWAGLLLIVVVITLAWQKENHWIRTHLADEGPEVLAPEHFVLTQRYAQRGGFLLARLRGQNVTRARLEHDLHQTATRLAFSKHRLTRGVVGAEQETARHRARLQALNQQLAGYDAGRG